MARCISFVKLKLFAYVSWKTVLRLVEVVFGVVITKFLEVGQDKRLHGGINKGGIIHDDGIYLRFSTNCLVKFIKNRAQAFPRFVHRQVNISAFRILLWEWQTSSNPWHVRLSQLSLGFWKIPDSQTIASGIALPSQEIRATRCICITHERIQVIDKPAAHLAFLARLGETKS